MISFQGHPSGTCSKHRPIGAASDRESFARHSAGMRRPAITPATTPPSRVAINNNTLFIMPPFLVQPGVDNLTDRPFGFLCRRQGFVGNYPHGSIAKPEGSRLLTDEGFTPRCTRISPPVGLVRQPGQLMSVVLPEPLGPMMATDSPAAAVRLTPATARIDEWPTWKILVESLVASNARWG